MREFIISFNDLNEIKKQELILEIQRDLLEKYEVEGKEFLTRKWNDPKPRTWQETFIRIYDIDFRLWETPEEIKTFDWVGAVNTHAEIRAEEKLYDWLTRMEIDV